jgi:hypothetical protein
MRPEFHRLQVKYRSARAGAVKVQFRSMWADRPLTLSGIAGINDALSPSLRHAPFPVTASKGLSLRRAAD